MYRCYDKDKISKKTLFTAKQEEVNIVRFFSIIQIINILIILLVLGLGIYLAILAIKALKIYIEKNS